MSRISKDSVGLPRLQRSKFHLSICGLSRSGSLFLNVVSKIFMHNDAKIDIKKTDSAESVRSFPSERVAYALKEAVSRCAIEVIGFEIIFDFFKALLFVIGLSFLERHKAGPLH